MFASFSFCFNLLNYRQSVVTLEVKPWDDETDMKKLEESVRSIQTEGLVWGASKLVPIGYGIRKLQITLVIGMYLTRVLSTDNGSVSHTSTEDELVSLDELQEKIAEFEDYVQSSDVAAMQSRRAGFYCIQRGSDFIPQSCKLREWV